MNSSKQVRSSSSPPNQDGISGIFSIISQVDQGGSYVPQDHIERGNIVNEMSTSISVRC